MMYRLIMVRCLCDYNKWETCVKYDRKTPQCDRLEVLKQEFNSLQSMYAEGSIIPYRRVAEKILRYCKISKGKCGFYEFEDDLADIIGYSIKPNIIYLNPNFFNTLKVWAVFLSVVVHEIGHLKGMEHTETGIMAPVMNV